MTPRFLFVVILFIHVPALSADMNVWIQSRDIQIPATLVLPETDTSEGAPLVVLVHGHGGTRQENGAFTELASMLAEVGIASIRMDFAGCGDSTEAFIHNNITTMLQDIEAATQFAVEHPGIDGRRVGILGYSMGGRLAMLAADDRHSAMVLWAPVAFNGAKPMIDYLGGEDDYDSLRAQAKEQGSVVFVTSWGAEHLLGWQWFEDMEQSSPLDAISDYEGALLILHGTEDQLISPGNSVAVDKAASGTTETTLITIEGASHGFGFFSPDPLARDTVLASTVGFFREHLLASD